MIVQNQRGVALVIVLVVIALLSITTPTWRATR